MNDPGRIVILGAGPTGLGAAYRLAELGYDRWTVIERADRPGGLATSYVDPQGFTWDNGGHVQFSHYWYYDALCDRALGGQWLDREREAWIWIKGRFVPYPFQNNLHRLDPADRDAALAGLLRVAESPRPRPAHFEEWVLSTFGNELTELFFRPYNEKVWGYPLHQLGVSWMGERVAGPDLARIQRNIRDGTDDVSWGPNNRFRFPLHGGTGAIWRGVAALLPREQIILSAEVIRIEGAARELVLGDGRRVPYDVLISTVPLDVLCTRLHGVDDHVRAPARGMKRGAVHVIGLGLAGAPPETLARKCWMYFPEGHSPYFRVTVFSNYSPYNVPPGEYWSLMAEVSETPYRRIDPATVLDHAERAMRQDGLLMPATRVVSRYHHYEAHGYPTPFLDRDQRLQQILPALERHRIYSRGRFGAWKYEVSNQDHSCMQGVELVDRLLAVGASDEPTLNRPDFVNGGVFATRPDSTS